MAPTSVLEALAAVPSQPDAGEAFKSILANIRTLSSPATIASDMKTLISAILSASLGFVTTPQLTSDFVDVLRSLDNPDLWLDVGQHLLSQINQSTNLSTSLIDSASSVRELLATAHERQEDYSDAARVLSEIPLDSSARRLDNAERAKIWIRIVRNYLEVDDALAAETFLNKLKNVMPDVTDVETILLFQLSAARIQDSKRQFLAAAQSYHKMSYADVVDEGERLHTLRCAIRCAVLAPAGPPRHKVLAVLYKDERAVGVEEHGILEKVFKGHLLEKDEVANFAKELAPHQRAITSDGSTILDRAVVEHNLLAISQLYMNVGFDDLAWRLGLEADDAEQVAMRMIQDGRLNGTIDQIDRLIQFRQVDSSVEAVGEAMRRQDANVQAVAEEVERVANHVSMYNPGLEVTV